MTRGVLLSFLLLLSPVLHAFGSRLVDAQGRAVAGAEITVVDQQSGGRTDAAGRFTLVPAPRLPATLIVIGGRGELYPPIYLPSLVPEVRLEQAYRESITVTSGAAPNIEGTPAAAPLVVGAEEIEQRKPAHVVEAIASTPGVSVRGEGAPAVPVVRGLAGGRTLLLIDDARIVAERRAGPSATFVDPISLGSIEVSRGPGSVAYGSDAIGGVVHLRPRDPVAGQPEVRYDIWSSFGGTNARSAAAEVSADLLGGAFLAALHARSADDAHDADGEPIENSQYRGRGVMLRFVRDLEWGRMRIGGMSSIARDVGAPSTNPAKTIYPDERATLLTFALDMPQGNGAMATAVRSSLGSYSVTTDRVRESGVESSAVKARDASFRLSGERSGNSRIITGVDFVSRFDLRASGSIEDADRYDGGIFGSWTGAVGQALQISAGARLDHITTRNDGGYFGTRSRSDVAPSGYAAATTGPYRGVTATLQLASGYREPTLSDRYYRGVSGRGFVTGNPELEPERSVQVDGGVRWSGARSRIALFGYDYRIRDLVERYRADGDFYFRNRGEARIRGVELELATRLRRGFELQAGAAVARGEDAESGDALDDIAPAVLHTSLRWAAEHASAFVTVSAFGRDDRPGPVEVERPGYVDAEIGAGWRVSPSFEVRIVVRNVANTDRFGSADEEAALAPGRSVMIGINR
jgi:outer membrane receptor protein involved in Fe transport